MCYKIPVFLLLFLIKVSPANAFSAVATIKGHASDTWRVGFNYDSQKSADKAAVAGCKKQAVENGLGKLAAQCKVVNRGKGPGYGAVVCGKDGCGWTLGYATKQEAVDAAYEHCAESYQQCQTENITAWEDFRGFKVKNDVATRSGDCRPKTRELRCTSNCVNGNCLITYENGCRIKVQVSPRFDGFSNQWTYPSPSC